MQVDWRSGIGFQGSLDPSPREWGSTSTRVSYLVTGHNVRVWVRKEYLGGSIGAQEYHKDHTTQQISCKRLIGAGETKTERMRDREEAEAGHNGGDLLKGMHVAFGGW